MAAGGATRQPARECRTSRCSARPDRIELMECWDLALHRTDGPSVIAVPPGLLPQPAQPDGAGAARRAGAGQTGRRSPSILRNPPRRRIVAVRMPADGAATSWPRPASQWGVGVATGASAHRDVTLDCDGSRAGRWRWPPGIAWPAGMSPRRLSRCLAGSCSRARGPPTGRPSWGPAPRVGIEAASGFGWERWLGADGVFIGMDEFGVPASGKRAVQAVRHHAGGGGRERAPPAAHPPAIDRTGSTKAARWNPGPGARNATAGDA